MIVNSSIFYTHEEYCSYLQFSLSDTEINGIQYPYELYNTGNDNEKQSLIPF